MKSDQNARPVSGSNPIAPGKRRETGFAHEAHAARYLTQQGLRLIESNFTCRVGEIDLVMRDGETLVFVEVRYRTRIDFIDPVTSVNYRKQQKLLRTAAIYLKFHGLTNRVRCRIDVVGIVRLGDKDDLSFRWIKNAIHQQV